MTDWTISQIKAECIRRGRGVSEEWIRRACREGRIKGAAKPGGRDWFVPEDEAERWIEEYVKRGKN